MHYDKEFRREESTSAVGSSANALTVVRIELQHEDQFDPTPMLDRPGVSFGGALPCAEKTPHSCPTSVSTRLEKATRRGLSDRVPKPLHPAGAAIRLA